MMLSKTKNSENVLPYSGDDESSLTTKKANKRLCLCVVDNTRFTEND